MFHRLSFPMMSKSFTSPSNGASLFETLSLVREHCNAADARWKGLIRSGGDPQEVAQAFGAYMALCDFKTDLVTKWPIDVIHL